jgi:hypothetical protein
MLSGTVEPECRRRRRMILLGNAGADTAAPVAVLSSADNAPDRQATKALAQATIHPPVDGSATTGRQLFVTATDHCWSVLDWAHSIAVN